MSAHDYECVIGLEIHAQLLTKSKLFCSCSTSFGSSDNANTCPVCIGLPGALPVLNKKALEFSIATGLALNCKIDNGSVFARKNYFYPDLPKGYQISQFDLPLCTDGYVDFFLGEERKRVVIQRAHMEEDAGKSSHHGDFTLVNYNRSSVPLLEIVSGPDMRSPQEAAEYAKAVRSILVYLEVCDGNLEEGSMRCDCNVSVRKKGETKLNTRVELKNINSFRFVEKAIQYEIDRQIDLMESGEKIVQETRLYDPDKNRTFTMRTKEEAHDYRYFPDPDLLAVKFKEDLVAQVKAKLPELPMARAERFQSNWSLPKYDSLVLTQTKQLANYFEQVAETCGNPKSASNWVIGASISPRSIGTLVIVEVDPAHSVFRPTVELPEVQVARSHMVKDHVKNDTEAVLVAFLNETLERIWPAVGHFHREEMRGIVAPRPVSGKLGHGQNFHRVDPQPLQVTQPFFGVSKGARPFAFGVLKCANVHFVNDQFIVWSEPREFFILAPVEILGIVNCPVAYRTGDLFSIRINARELIRPIADMVAILIADPGIVDDAGPMTGIVPLQGILAGGELVEAADHRHLLSKGGPNSEGATFLQQCRSQGGDFRLLGGRNGHGQTLSFIQIGSQGSALAPPWNPGIQKTLRHLVDGSSVSATVSVGAILVDDFANFELAQVSAGASHGDDSATVLQCFFRVDGDALRHSLVLQIASYATGDGATYGCTRKAGQGGRESASTRNQTEAGDDQRSQSGQGTEAQTNSSAFACARSGVGSSGGRHTGGSLLDHCLVFIGTQIIGRKEGRKVFLLGTTVEQRR